MLGFRAMPSVFPEPLAASRRFRRYKKEDAKGSRSVDIGQDERLQSLMHSFESFAKKPGSPFLDRLSKIPQMYAAALKLASGLDYGARDIEAFSIMLADCPSVDRTGEFLSALIGRGNDEEYILHISGDLSQARHICHCNEKRVCVHGDVGSGFASSMADGEVLLLGNAGTHAGSGMEGGLLVIDGDAGDFLGGGVGYSSLYKWYHSMAPPFKPMVEGRIVVNGDAGEAVGDRMRGGEIHLNGGYGSIGHDVKGKIIHRGKLIAGK